MVHMQMKYTGGLRCELTHGPSGALISTDAPTDNNGKGEAFSPSDLVSSAVAACMATIMGIVADRNNLDINGMKVDIKKEMIQSPERRIGTIHLHFHMPQHYAPGDLEKLQKAANTCPVKKSLHPDVRINVNWTFPPK